MSFAALKERTTELMEENMTLSRLNLILISAVILLAGICLGLLAAPLTHGVSIGSFNGGNSYGSDNNDEKCEK